MIAFIPQTDVLDEVDFAQILEENERQASIKAILKNKPMFPRNIESLIDPDKECDDCGSLIPVERQRVILTINNTCDYCVLCQEMIAKEDRLYGR